MRHGQRHYWKWYFDCWRGHFGYGLFLVALTIVSTLVSIAFPIFFKYLIDALAGSAGTNGAAATDKAALMSALRSRYLLILLGIGVFRFVSGLYPYFRSKMNMTIEVTVRKVYFDHILERGHRFFQAFRTGDLVTRLTDDLSNFSKVAWFGCSAIFRAFNSASIVLFCVAAMLWLNVRLTLLAVLPLPFAFLLFMMISKRLRKAYDESQAAVSATNNHLEACLSGVRILKAYNADPRESDRFEKVLAERFRLDFKVVRIAGLMDVFFEFISYASQVLVVLFGGLMVVRGELSIGDYYAFFTYLAMIVHPMLDLPTLLVTSGQAFACVDRLEEIREFPETDPAGQGVALPGGTIDSIELDRVSFAYGGPADAVRPPGDAREAPFALRDVSLTLKRGETVAVVGPIGSGKTTLIHLLTGIYTPDAGTVRVNGCELGQLDVADFRGRIGYVGQEPVVFSASIGQNIKFFRDYPETSLAGAAKLAQFDGEIRAFPGGYDQEVGQRGVTISGGQKQRLTIARSLIGVPELLVMDDVTASLDAENEERFWGEVGQAIGGMSVVAVTHRLATARRADRIIVLNDGRVEATGTFAELRVSSPTFRKMIED